MHFKLVAFCGLLDCCLLCKLIIRNNWHHFIAMGNVWCTFNYWLSVAFLTVAYFVDLYLIVLVYDRMSYPYNRYYLRNLTQNSYIISWKMFFFYQSNVFLHCFFCIRPLSGLLPVLGQLEGVHNSYT